MSNNTSDSLLTQNPTFAPSIPSAPLSSRARFASAVRGFLSFYLGAFPTAFKRAGLWALLVSSILGILFPLIRDLAKPKPEQEAAMSSLLWEIPLFIFGFFIVSILAYTPYLRFQQLKKKSADSEKQLREEIKRLGKEHARKLEEANNNQNTYFYREVL